MLSVPFTLSVIFARMKQCCSTQPSMREFSLCRSYAHFCACGKMLDARLEQLGAKRFSGRADINREDWKAVDAWIQAAVADLDSLQLKAHSSRAGACLLSGQFRPRHVFSPGYLYLPAVEGTKSCSRGESC